MLEPGAWWSTMDADTLRCLGEHGPMNPAELGKRLGISEDGVTSLVSHLASRGEGPHLPGRGRRVTGPD